MKKLTQKQIKNMIRLLEKGVPGPNITTVVLAAANWWTNRWDGTNAEDIEDAEYLCLWIKKLLDTKDIFYFRESRLDYWLIKNGHVKDIGEIRKQPDKWKATQRAMLDWMASELRKELKEKNSARKH